MKNFLFLVLAFVMASTAIQADVFETCDSLEQQSVPMEQKKNLYVKFLGAANFLRMHKSCGYYRYDDYQRLQRPHVGRLLSGSLGYQFLDDLSVEIEYAYRENSITRHAARNFYYLKYYQTSSCMVNVMWSLPLAKVWSFEPFVGAGVGADFVKYYGKSLAWQLISGLSYTLDCNTALSLEYRFHRSVDRTIFYKRPNNHSIGLGLAYHFGLGSTVKWVKEKGSCLNFF